MCLAARRPSNGDEQRLDGTPFARPSAESNRHRLTDVGVIGRTRDDHDHEIGPSIAQPAAYAQPVLTTEIQVKCHDVNLMMGEQVQNLPGGPSGPHDREVGLDGESACQGFGKHAVVINHRNADGLGLHLESLAPATARGSRQRREQSLHQMYEIAGERR